MSNFLDKMIWIDFFTLKKTKSSAKKYMRPFFYNLRINLKIPPFLCTPSVVQPEENINRQNFDICFVVFGTRSFLMKYWIITRVILCLSSIGDQVHQHYTKSDSRRAKTFDKMSQLQVIGQNVPHSFVQPSKWPASAPWWWKSLRHLITSNPLQSRECPFPSSWPKETWLLVLSQAQRKLQVLNHFQIGSIMLYLLMACFLISGV